MWLIKLVMEDKSELITKAEGIEPYLDFKPGQRVNCTDLEDNKTRTIKQVKVKEKNAEDYRDIETAAGKLHARELLR